MAEHRGRFWVAGVIVAGLAGASPASGMLPGSVPAQAVVRGAVPADDPVDQEVPDDGVVTVTGSGFGHGVGMSQYGALGMARGGASASAILRHFYAGTKVASYPDDVDLRVNVVDRGTSVDLAGRALAGGGGALQLVTGGRKVIDLPAGSTVEVTMDGGSLSVTTTRPDGGTATVTTGGLTVRWSGGRALAGPASVLDVTSRSANAESTSSKSRSYRWGALYLSPVPRTDSDAVVRTRIEAVAILNLHREYLRGIAEVPASWPVAALQAQAIAARNYALAERAGGTTATCGGCHLWDDTRSQVYRGWSAESAPTYGARWVAAVRATQTSRTRGLTVLYGGRPITAYYSSSSGGRTRDSGSAWGNALPYLRSVSDPWSVDPSVNPGYAQWRREVPRDRLTALFGLPDLASVEVAARDRSGAAITVTATAADGTVASLPGTVVRSKLGLPAPWLTSFELP